MKDVDDDGFLEALRQADPLPEHVAVHIERSIVSANNASPVGSRPRLVLAASLACLFGLSCGWAAVRFVHGASDPVRAGCVVIGSRVHTTVGIRCESALHL